MTTCDFVVAVPSYKRAEIFKNKTFAFLQRAGVPLDKVLVFLSDDEDMFNYSMIDSEFHYICDPVAMPNLREKFNYIHRCFAPGKKVVVMEDDIDDVIRGLGGNKKESAAPTFIEECNKAFKVCESVGSHIWGVAPHSNAFYMQQKITHSLKFVVANVFGFIATGNPRLEITRDAKSDYERTLLYFIEYGKTTRVDYLGVKTENYVSPGGLQSESTREERAAREHDACNYLTTRYPHLVSLNSTKKSLYPELRLTTIRSKDSYMDWKAYQKVLDAKLFKQ